MFIEMTVPDRVWHTPATQVIEQALKN